MRLTFFLAMLVSLVFAGIAGAQEAQAPDAVKTDLLEKGKKVYFKRCVWCHGVEGGGDGPSTDRLFRRPRNLIQGTFKIRVTDSGELPLDEDLIKTVKNGLPGSAMPAWGEFLGEDEIVAVVNFVKTKEYKEPGVLLFADRDLSYQKLFSVMDQIRTAGINRISLQAEVNK